MLAEPTYRKKKDRKGKLTQRSVRDVAKSYDVTNLQNLTVGGALVNKKRFNQDSGINLSLVQILGNCFEQNKINNSSIESQSTLKNS